MPMLEQKVERSTAMKTGMLLTIIVFQSILNSDFNDAIAYLLSEVIIQESI